jgi:predicted ATPase/DNA-binding SARP family transcriptional activator
MIEVQLLGPVRAVVDGEVVSIDSARRRALLAVLALRHGATLSVDTLCEALWGDDLPANARGNLQSHVSRLRSRLGEGVIVLDHGGYRLDLGGGRTDVEDVEALVGEAEARRPVAPAEAARLYADALASWRGQSLVEFTDHPAFLPDATRLDELRRSLVDHQHEAELDAGRAAAALPGIEQTAAADPLRERSQLILMRALYLSGRSADALRAGDAYRRRLVEETGLDPSGSVSDLEREILAGDGPGPPPSPGGGAPSAPTDRPPARGVLPRSGRFFGRQAELDRLHRSLADERVVTVVGPGGVGKTRLVAEALARGGLPSAETHVIVELAKAGQDDVVAAAASSLGLRAGTGDLLDAVIEYLAVERTLLVLDNCEHVAPEARALIEAVLAGCPGVTVLATSRTRLGLHDERLLPLGPLPVDGDVAVPAGVELFVDRVGRASHDAVMDESDPVVRRICRRLDGIPLALELAASRVPTLGPGALYDRLDDALDLLEAPVLGPERRHATLRAVVDWSYRLLDDDGRELLHVLAVFEGGFDIGAAEQVGAEVIRVPVAVVLGRLVDASLVLVDTSRGSPRYRMLEAVRQRGLEELSTGDREATARRAHARWIVDQLERAVRHLAGPDEMAVAPGLERERGNIRLALRWLVDDEQSGEVARSAGALAQLCLYRPDAEWLRWVRAAVDGPMLRHDDRLEVRAAAARAAYLQGDLAAVPDLARPVVDAGLGGRAAHLAHHSLGVASLYAGHHDEAERWWHRTADDTTAPPTDRLDALGGITLARCYAGRLEEAQAVADEHRALADAIDSVTYRAFADYLAGEIALAGRDEVAAVRSLDAAVTGAEGSGADFVRGIALTALASALVRRGETREVLRRLPELIELWRRSSTWPQLWTTLRLAAAVLVEGRRPDVAALALDAADSDAAAPAVAGDDGWRLHELRQAIAADLDGNALDAIGRRAGVLPRARVLNEVLVTLEQLRDETTDA